MAAGPLETRPLLPESLPADPFPLLVEWFERARAERVQPNPDSMALATVDADGTPSVRIVLAKRIDPARGFVEWFTNYDSRKSAALAARPVASVVFHWDVLERQARVEGPVTRSPAEESDRYFSMRPWGAKVGAWASAQSRVVASRGELMEKFGAAMKRFGLDPGVPPPSDAPVQVPRPPNWGGWRLWARRVELWCGHRWRLHDRAEWTRVLMPEGDGFRGGVWGCTRVQP